MAKRRREGVNHLSNFEDFGELNRTLNAMHRNSAEVVPSRRTDLDDYIGSYTALPHDDIPKIDSTSLD